MPEVTLEDVRAAVNLPEFDFAASHLRMAPLSKNTPPDLTGLSPRQAGALALIYPEIDGTLYLILTLRTTSLRGHSGQISFPGGRRDPDDESFTATALRETCEELGICDAPITILGMLSRVYIPPTNFEVFPTVAYTPQRPEMFPNPDEVAEVITFPLRDLLDDTYKHDEERQFQGIRVRVPFYLILNHKVWGATAVMLSELEHRLRIIVC